MRIVSAILPDWESQSHSHSLFFHAFFWKKKCMSRKTVKGKCNLADGILHGIFFRLSINVFRRKLVKWRQADKCFWDTLNALLFAVRPRYCQHICIFVKKIVSSSWRTLYQNRTSDRKYSTRKPDVFAVKYVLHIFRFWFRHNNFGWRAWKTSVIARANLSILSTCTSKHCADTAAYAIKGMPEM